MSREQDESTVEAHYGIDSEIGSQLLVELVAEMGTNALSDRAMKRLALMHQNKHVSAGSVHRG